MMISREYVLGLAVPVGILGFSLLYLSRRDKPKTGIDSPTQDGHRPRIADLRDPSIRANHIEFNKHLIAQYPEVDAIELSDQLAGNRVFLVHKHQRVLDVIRDIETFTSNPWPTKRPLVTLNTMDKNDHDRIYRLIKSFYTRSAVESMEEVIANIIEEHGRKLLEDGDVYRFSKRLHMHLSLITSGVCSDATFDCPLIDEFINYNDIAVRITAPLGGVGNEFEYTWKRVYNLAVGLWNSLRGTFGLIRRIGIQSTWALLTPSEALLPSPPYTHIWDYPEDLPVIVRYFNRLYDCMSLSPSTSPVGALFSHIGTDVSAAEAIGTAVQLMVNMTTANAIQSFLFRRCFNKDVSPDMILFSDAPLQRNPRRAIRNGRIGSVIIPKGSLIILMIGAANLDCPAGAQSMTFGLGLHHCLGRHLVTLEMMKVDEWLTNIQRSFDMELDGSPIRLTDVDVGNWGFVRLVIRFVRKNRNVSEDGLHTPLH